MTMVMTKSLLLFFFLTQWVRKRSNSEWLLNLRHLHDFNWFGAFISSKEYNKNHFFPTNLNNESDRDVTTLTVTLKEILQSYPKVFFFFFFQIFALLFLWTHTLTAMYGSLYLKERKTETCADCRSKMRRFSFFCSVHT